MARVELRRLAKSFADQPVLRHCDLVIEDGELVVLVGPSGCGKSTILRLIAGLEHPDSGEVVIGGQVVNEIEPMHRDIAMVFQDYALYPHMTVGDNLGFGLRMRKQSRDRIQLRVQQVAALLDIQDLLARRPRELSGGQRQRVAMGRALVREPSVFLLDEPLSNLDAQLRTQVRVEIKKLHDSLGTTMIYVTHDQVEAMTLADRLVVLRQGIIEQSGTPHEVYSAPRTMFVAGFIGSPTMNFLPCRLIAHDGDLQVALADGARLTVPPDRAQRHAEHVDRPVILGLRPEAVSVLPDATDLRRNELAAIVTMLEPLGAETLYSLQLGCETLVAKVSSSQQHDRGERVVARIDMTHMHLFNSTEGETL